MKTTRVKILLTSMLFLTAVPSMIFSSERRKYCRERNPSSYLRKDEILPESEPTLLSSVIADGNLEDVKLLLKSKVDVNTTKGAMALSQAVFYNHSDIVKWLIEFKVDVNAKSVGGFTALKLAKRMEERSKMVNLLLKNNADPQSQDNED